MTFVFPKDPSIIINSKNRHSSLVNLALISINMYVFTFLLCFPKHRRYMYWRKLVLPSNTNHLVGLKLRFTNQRKTEP